MKTIYGSIDLQLFNEGADGAGETDGTTASTQLSQTGENFADTAPDSDAGNNNEEASEESFEDLIRGKYKDDYNKSVQRVINRRFAAEKAKNEENESIMMKLYARYGVDNPQALRQVLDSEEELENRSAATGKSPEDIRELEQLRAAALKYELSERQNAAQRQYFAWKAEAEQVKNQYPDFDLDTELQNPQFRALISTKNPQYAISMEQAYKVIHFEELQTNAQKAAASKVAQNVQVRSQRPDENALGSQGSASVKTDVSKLTKKERAEFAKRAAKGETITFR